MRPGTPHLALLLLAAAAFGAAGCGASSSKTQVDRVGLKPIDVRDSTFAGPGGAVGGSPGGGGGPGSASGGGTGTGTDRQATLIDSVTAFSTTAYPLLNKWCAGCHAQIQSPFFAQKDVQKAHDSIRVAQKVDFTNLADSRVVLRLGQDQHNCPTGVTCADAAAQLLAALQQWVSLSQKPATNPAQLLQTAEQTIAGAQVKTVPGANPPGVLMFEAEKLTLKTPMAAAAVATASGGMVVSTPAAGASDVNVTTAAANAALGTALLTFNVTTAGTYQIQGYVSGVAASASFYVNMDKAGLAPWLFTPTAAGTFAYSTASATAGGPPMTFTLAAGSHTLEIRERQSGATLDKVILSSVPGFDPQNAEPATKQIQLLTYDLAGLTKIQGAQLTIELSDYSDTAYIVRNPTLVLPAGTIHVKDLQILVNGADNPQYATFSVIDATVAAPGGVLLPAALVVLKDKGDAKDQFAVAFTTIEAK